jgi:Lon protease-like protein
MQNRLLLPLFPLQVVLFPGGPLPLHIFEERYKEMIAEAIRDQSEFGILLVTGNGLSTVGSTAVVEKVLHEYPDGRLDIMTRGKRRFELLLVNEERNFLRGSVEFFEDEASAAPDAEAREGALHAYNEFRAVAPEAPPAPVEDPLLSFALAEPIEDPSFRQSLVAARSEAERLRRLAEYFRKFSAREKRTRDVKDLASRNGHGKREIS